MASQKVVLEAVKRRCDEVESRFDGYHKELLNAVADILLIERNNKTSPTNVGQKVQDKIDALGDQIWRASRNDPAQKG
jgi:hypothetical protein